MSPVRPDVLAVRSRREELVSRCIQAQRKHGMGMVTTEGYIVIATDEAGLPTKLRGHFIYGTATDHRHRGDREEAEARGQEVTAWEFNQLLAVEEHEGEANRLALRNGFGPSFGASRSLARGDALTTWYRRGLVMKSASGFKVVRHSTARIYQNAE